MYTLSFLTPKAQEEFIQLFGDSEDSIKFHLCDFINLLSTGFKFTDEMITVLNKAGNAIASKRYNNYNGIHFFIHDLSIDGKTHVEAILSWEDIDPEYYEDDMGNVYSTKDDTVKAVRKAIKDFDFKVDDERGWESISITLI